MSNKLPIFSSSIHTSDDKTQGQQKLQNSGGPSLLDIENFGGASEHLSIGSLKISGGPVAPLAPPVPQALEHQHFKQSLEIKVLYFF